MLLPILKWRLSVSGAVRICSGKCSFQRSGSYEEGLGLLALRMAMSQDLGQITALQIFLHTLALLMIFGT